MKSWLSYVTIPLVGIGSWLLIAMRRPAEYLLPHPYAVASELARGWRVYLVSTATTALEAAVGFVGAALLAILLAALFTEMPRVRTFVLPYAVTLKTLPVIALAPILVLWFDTGFMSKVVTATIIAFFPVLITADEGFRDVDSNSRELFRTFNATRAQTFRLLRLPSALPSVFSGLKICASLSIVGALVGEFVSPSGGLGKVLVRGQANLETVHVFAALVCTGILGLLFFGAVWLAERRFLRWRL